MAAAMELDLPFTVDTWTRESRRTKKKFHFLTHAHKDHTAGMLLYASPTIFCTSITRRLVMIRCPSLDPSIFVDLEVGESIVVRDDAESFTVTAYDANHCPGAIMLLFEGGFGNILHTGDCRLTADCISQLPRKFFAKRDKSNNDGLDCLFLDCTFAKESLKIPSKYAATTQVLECIRKYSAGCLVYLACDLLGQEEILSEISKTFGSKIYVDKSILPEYHAMISILQPHLLTDDPSCRFHVCEGFPRLYDKAKLKFDEAEKKGQPKPLFIRPSTQWYICEERDEAAIVKGFAIPRRFKNTIPKEAERDQYEVWHVCYSMHSSQMELEDALSLLCPKAVVSTTPSCRASELAYVRNLRNIFETHYTCSKAYYQANLVPKKPNDALDQSHDLDVANTVSCSRTQKVVEDAWIALGEAQSRINEQFGSPKKPIPLFGRARNTLPLSPPLCFRDEDNNPSPDFDIASCDSDHKTDAPPHSPDVPCIASSPRSLQSKEQWMDSHSLVDASVMPNLVEEDTSQNRESTTATSNKVVNESLVCDTDEEPRMLHKTVRQMYRSLHVPIPRTLPSLSKLQLINNRGEEEEGSYRANLYEDDVCQNKEGTTSSSKTRPNLVEDDVRQNREVTTSSNKIVVITETHVGDDKEKPRMLHESVRKLYRSLHVSIPQALPSLAELQRFNKRARFQI